MDPVQAPFPFASLPKDTRQHIASFLHAKDISNAGIVNKACQTLFNFEGDPRKLSRHQRFTYLLSSNWLAEQSDLKAIYDFLSTPLKKFTKENWIAELQEAIGERLTQSTEGSEVDKTILAVVTIAAAIFKHDRVEHWEQRLQSLKQVLPPTLFELAVGQAVEGPYRNLDHLHEAVQEIWPQIFSEWPESLPDPELLLREYQSQEIVNIPSFFKNAFNQQIREYRRSKESGEFEEKEVKAKSEEETLKDRFLDPVFHSLPKDSISEHSLEVRYVHATIVWETPQLWASLSSEEQRSIQKILNQTGEPPTSSSGLNSSNPRSTISLGEKWLNYRKNCNAYMWSGIRPSYIGEAERLLRDSKVSLMQNLMFTACAKELDSKELSNILKTNSLIPNLLDECYVQAWKQFHIKPYSEATRKARQIAWQQFLKTARADTYSRELDGDSSAHISLEEARIITAALREDPTIRTGLFLQKCSVAHAALQELSAHFKYINQTVSLQEGHRPFLIKNYNIRALPAAIERVAQAFRRQVMKFSENFNLITQRIVSFVLKAISVLLSGISGIPELVMPYFFAIGMIVISTLVATNIHYLLPGLSLYPGTVALLSFLSTLAALLLISIKIIDFLKVDYAHQGTTAPPSPAEA